MVLLLPELPLQLSPCVCQAVLPARAAPRPRAIVLYYSNLLPIAIEKGLQDRDSQLVSLAFPSDAKTKGEPISSQVGSPGLSSSPVQLTSEHKSHALAE